MHTELTPNKLLPIMPLEIIALEVPNFYHSFLVSNKRVIKDIYYFRGP